MKRNNRRCAAGECAGSVGNPACTAGECAGVAGKHACAAGGCAGSAGEPLCAAGELAVGTAGVEGVRFTARGLEVYGEGLSAAAFLQVFAAVMAMNQAVNWLLGDVLVLAERRWGNQSTGSKYEEASRATGLSLTTLRGIVCTCRAYPLELRHEKLSFSHHREAMAGSPEPEQREAWLVVAEREGMSCAAFRRYLRAEAGAALLSEEERWCRGREGAGASASELLFSMPQGGTSVPLPPGTFELSRFALWAERHRAESLPLPLRRELLQRLEPLARYREKLLQSIGEEEARGEEARGRGRKSAGGVSFGLAREGSGV